MFAVDVVAPVPFVNVRVQVPAPLTMLCKLSAAPVVAPDQVIMISVLTPVMVELFNTNACVAPAAIEIVLNSTLKCLLSAVNGDTPAATSVGVTLIPPTLDNISGTVTALDVKSRQRPVPADVTMLTPT